MDSQTFGTISPFLILLLVFAFVVLVVAGAGPLVLTRLAARRRLSGAGIVAPEEAVRASLRQDRVRKGWSSLVDKLEARGLSLADSNESRLRKTLVKAGYTHPQAPRIYTLARLMLTLGLPALYLAFTPLLTREASLMRLYIVGAVLALLGLYLPNLIVALKGSSREREIVNGFPDALDLMLVCIEAGLGLDAAFNRVGAEMMKSHPVLSEQLLMVTLELRAGRSREDALRHLAERTGVEDLRSFTTLLIQSEKLGSSIAQTLRIYSAEMREKRQMRAEEKAHRLPVLLSVPLVACLLPTMIAVLMLPAVIRFIRQVSPQLGGG